MNQQQQTLCNGLCTAAKIAKFWPWLTLLSKLHCNLVDTRTSHSGMGCSQEDKDAAVAACGKVAAHEQAFWQMAYEG